MADDVHVRPDPGGWAVVRAGETQARFVFPNRHDAVSAGRQLANRDRVELIVHGEDGQVVLSYDYRNNPFPRR